MIARNALAALLVAASSCAAFAADWVERPYNPPLGSRWLISAESRVNEVREAGPRTLNSTARSEFTIESKTDEGYKVVFVMRDIEVDGTSPTVAVMRQVSEAMKGIVVRGTIDKSGKPLRVDNIDETRAAMRQVIDRMVAVVKGKPQVAKFIEDIMSGMLMLDATKAAGVYFESLPSLAVGQQTGLKLGEVRRSVDETPSPFGGSSVKSNVAVQILKADAATGKVSLLQTTTYDPVSIKDFSTNAAKQLMAASGNQIPPDQLAEMMRKISMTLDGRLEIEVEDGMTRRMVDTTITTASLMGHTFNKREVKTVTVTRAP